MTRFLLRRLLQAVPAVFGTLLINFAVLHLAPGDAVDVLAGEAGAVDKAYLDQLRVAFGLDQPLLVQLYRYVVNILSLNLGYSFRQNMPVADLIAGRLAATLLLMGVSITLALVGGVVLGVAASRRAGRLTDRLISGLVLVFYSTPVFWIGLMMIVLFSVKLGWLPSGGFETIGAESTGVSRALDIGRHVLMPAMSLCLFYLAVYARLTRASMLEVGRQDFVTTARAKGVSGTRIAYRHVLPNAILPVVTLAGLNIGTLLGGAVVVEVVFGWPGIGRLALEAIGQRDYNVLLSLLFLSSILVIVLNIAVDLLYAWLDPSVTVE